MATQNASVADRIRLSYRAADAESEGDDGLDDDDLVHDRIQEPHFRAYLRRVHGGEVAVGDEWTEFVNCGCGSTTDVVVRVVSLDGGTTLTEDTEVTLVRAGADAAD